MKTFISNCLLFYLKYWARLRISAINPQIIGVTGSIGKSSCVYLLSSVLSPLYNTKTTYHGNSETGLPLELLDLRDELQNFSYLNWIKVIFKAPLQAVLNRPKWQLIIAEMGIDSPFEPKNMSYLLKIIQPNIGIFLNVAPVHTEQFKTIIDPHSSHLENDLLSAIADQKGLLVTSLQPSGYAIINTDFSQIRQLLPKIKAQTISIGVNQSADYHLISHRVNYNSSEFVCATPEGKISITITNQLLFKEFATSILALLATAKVMGLSPDLIKQKLTDDLKLPPGRQSILGGKHHSTIIDSSYNSSPTALTAQLNMLSKIPVKGKKIICIGDMNELGDLSATAHQQIAKLAATTADAIVLVGDQMQQYALPIISQLKPKLPLYSFQTSLGVGDFIADNLLDHDDLILVKGSQNRIFLEQTVVELLADSSLKPRLCRQSDFWDHKRQNYFDKHPNQQLYPTPI